MESRPRRTVGLARGFAAGVLALFALGWLLDRAHVALESHAWCPEHNQVEHATADRHPAVHGAPTAVAVERDGRTRGPALVPDDAAPGEHAACCVLLARGGDPVAVPAATVAWSADLAAGSALPAAARAGAARGSVPLLALAPKQSPPAA